MDLAGVARNPMADFQPLLLLLLILTASFANENEPIITTKYGKVRGNVLNVLDGQIQAFRGIPYAKTPSEYRRFSPPEPMDKWNDVRNTQTLPNSCYQLRDDMFPGFEGSEMWNPNTPVSEDCLYLNIWAPLFKTPTPRPEDRVPVLVWIYGGAFMSGTSTLDIYQGHFLCKAQNVVVVSINYRLGPLGFLAIPNNNNIRGNQGLLDQRLALQWVVDNIAAFGGDPTKITIFGESAGAASVGFHLVSPGSQGLFQRAVMQSGTPNAAWAIATKTEIYDRSLKLAKLLGCPVDHPSRLENCLLNADPKKMFLKQHENLIPPSVLPFPFVPHIDGDFLPSDIETLLNSSTLPKKELLIGLNKDEGTFFLFYGMPGFTREGESFITRNNFMDGLPLVINSSEIVKEAIISHYTDFRDEFNMKTNRDEMARVVGDVMFNCPVVNFATRYAERGSKTFFYFFDHVSSKNPWPKWAGVMHGYEIEFVFGMPLNPVLKYQQDEVALANKTMQHYGDFARTGNPKFKGGDWPLFKANTPVYVTLNDDSRGVQKNFKAKECRLWNNLFPKLQNMSDLLTRCSSSGIVQYNWMFLLILLVISLTH
ncbi:acetylcholinesterase isoform X1 [Poecilia reticulata]|uniref:acetylcholinesterase isoform X1 n=1 Tax=Poecilia reticulata TaxID=8081 RepID=UPI0004A478E0|nr:PREDICTED: cholinesterase isoform X1 [Poecilia reticulata]XP_008423570.1 PREDICTED: cholinesterase isoform X1 [Poecilia reticulata]XP_008423571.1 PREDICTED: cholinesterase isoform X1 [Poecilia reticulata]